MMARPGYAEFPAIIPRVIEERRTLVVIVIRLSVIRSIFRLRHLPTRIPLNQSEHLANGRSQEVQRFDKH